MAGKTATPEQVAQAVALRAAGLSLIGIAERTGVSVSTVQRLLRKHPTAKGGAKAALIESTKQELIGRVTSDVAIREEAARLIADDLAHTAMLRRKIAIAAEQLEATNLEEAALVMRAAAAYSVVIKNTSDTIRHVMPLEKTVNELSEERMPELVIKVLTDEEARALSAAGRDDEAI